LSTPRRAGASLFRLSNMEYFYDPLRKKTAAHIWTGSDTACTMFSTGGLKSKKRTVYPDNGNKRICVMCQNNWLKMQFKDRLNREL
jgi:hypothetical protein